jgi:hypothetical protein
VMSRHRAFATASCSFRVTNAGQWRRNDRAGSVENAATPDPSVEALLGLHFNFAPSHHPSLPAAEPPTPLQIISCRALCSKLMRATSPSLSSRTCPP